MFDLEDLSEFRLGLGDGLAEAEEVVVCEVVGVGGGGGGGGVGVVGKVSVGGVGGVAEALVEGVRLRLRLRLGWLRERSLRLGKGMLR